MRQHKTLSSPWINNGETVDTEYTLITLEEEYQEGRKWLIGPFLAANSSRYSQLIEIGYTDLQKVDENDRLHFHSHAEEYYVLLSGQMRIRVGSEEIDVEAGHILLIRPNVAHVILEVQQGTRILLIKVPPGGTDKTVVDDTGREKGDGDT